MFKSKISYDAAPTVGSREIIGPSSNRVALVLFPPAVGRVTLSNDPVLGDQQGLVLTAGQSPVYLDIATCGDVVQRGWHGLYTPAATGIAWIDVLP
jgi:hypothetical protein